MKCLDEKSGHGHSDATGIGHTQARIGGSLHRKKQALRECAQGTENDGSEAGPLNIFIVSDGVYKGFNPAVALSAKAVTLMLFLVLILAQDRAATAISALTRLTLGMFGGWYVLLMAAFVVFCIVLAALPVAGRIKLGTSQANPEHSTCSWLAMIFCSGIGVGILAFAVSEPLSHLTVNPKIIAMGNEASFDARAIQALEYVYLHWGFSAWACYAIVGLTLGLACHRFGHPLTIRSGMVPLLGRRLEGAMGHLVDIISLLAIIAGITTTIVLGLEQFCSGVATLTGSRFFADASGKAPYVALLAALTVTISTAIANILSGVSRGVKWTSQLGIALAFCVLAIFVTAGDGIVSLELLGRATFAYLRDFPILASTIYDPVASHVSAAQRHWQENWTIFYWAWWIAFAPFVGLFLAGISRGRTVRAFILGVMLCPTAMCFTWFAGIGGTAVLTELNSGGTAGLVITEHQFRLYRAADVLLSPQTATLAKTILTLLFFILIVSSTTAAIIAIKSIGAGGREPSESPLHSTLWATIIAAFAGAIVAVGGVSSIRDVMIIGAVPFSLIMALFPVSLVAMIRTARLDIDQPPVPLEITHNLAEVSVKAVREDLASR